MKSLICKLLLVAVCLVISTSAFAAPQVDGFLGTGSGANDTEYTNSFDVGWFNGHKTDKHGVSTTTIYPESSINTATGNQMTTGYWESTGGLLYLYLAAPLEAKNMIWGDGVTDAEAALYFVQWDTHHDTSKSLGDWADEKLDFGGMTGSERLIFGGGIDANLASGVSGATGLVDHKDSVDYVVGRTTFPGTVNNTLTNSWASDIPMAFEFSFNLNDIGDVTSFIDTIQANALEFHLSPERGGTVGSEEPIPEPATIALLGIGLAGLAGIGVRRRRKKKAVDNS